MIALAKLTARYLVIIGWLVGALAWVVIIVGMIGWGIYGYDRTIPTWMQVTIVFSAVPAGLFSGAGIIEFIKNTENGR